MKRLLNKSKSYRALKTIRESLRGAAFARSWQDSYAAGPEQRHPTLVPQSPLETYFDSVVEGPGIWKWRHYFDIYHRHFQRFVGSEVHIAEVGIYSGGSLEMWKAYFGSGCMVYGVDIEPACKIYEGERTRIFIGDQRDRSFWKNFRDKVPVLDIVVDDGGHLWEQQIVTLEETLPYLRPGGVYLCEDITGISNRFSGYVHALCSALNTFSLTSSEEAEVTPSAFQRSIGSIHHYPFVTVIEKASPPRDRLIAPKHGTKWQPFVL